MKNLRIKEACLVNGQHAPVGAIVKDVDTRTAAELVHMGRAEEITRVPKDTVENRDPITENRDPAPAKKDKGKPESKAE